MKRLKVKDKVIVITGKSKGKQGEIIAIDWKKNRVKVKDVNLVVCHVKPKRQGETGGLQKKESFIHVSNVLPVDTLTNTPVRLNKLKRK